MAYDGYAIDKYLNAAKVTKQLDELIKKPVYSIRPEKLEKVKQIMDHEKLGGISISSVMGCGTQRGVEETGVQSAVPANLLPKIRVQIVLEDEKVEDIIARIRDEVATGHVGDGKIFVRDVEDAVRIRTGEHGNRAL